MNRTWLTGSALLITAAAFVTPRSLQVSASAPQYSFAAKKVCKTATKTVHGKKKKVKVCKTVKPAPKPASTPQPTAVPVAPQADPKQAILATIDTHKSLAGGTVGFGAFWVPNTLEGTVTRIDLATNAVSTMPLPVGATPIAISAGAGSVWVLGSTALYRLDPATNKVTTLSVQVGAVDVAATDTAVWAFAPNSGDVVRIDPTTNQIVARISAPADARGITANDDMVWVGTVSNGAVHIDAHTNKVVASQVQGVAGQGAPMAIGEGGVWLQTRHDYPMTVTRVDPTLNATVAHIGLTTLGCGNPDSTGNCPERMAAGGGSVWATAGNANQLVRIDPTTNKPVAVLSFPDRVNSVFYGQGSLWVHCSCRQVVYRIDPAKVVGQ